MAASERERGGREQQALGKTWEGHDYPEGGPHSLFADLLACERARRRQDGTFDAPRFGRGDPGPAPADEPFGAPSAADAQRRLASDEKRRRDITSQSGSGPDVLRPALPARLQEIFGRAARRTSGLVDALPRIALERGMVDTTGSQAVVRFPALASGAAVAAQAENAAVKSKTRFRLGSQPPSARSPGRSTSAASSSTSATPTSTTRSATTSAPA